MQKGETGTAGTFVEDGKEVKSGGGVLRGKPKRIYGEIMTEVIKSEGRGKPTLTNILAKSATEKQKTGSVKVSLPETIRKGTEKK